MDAKKTYYYNTKGGVTPADHDIKHAINWCDGEGSGYHIPSARLEISNPKTYSEYLKGFSGHYVKSVADLHEAHIYLIDLVQAMLAELMATNYGPAITPGQMSAVIEDSYADGTLVVYTADYYAHNKSINVHVDGYGQADGDVMDGEALKSLVRVTPPADKM